MNIGHYSNTWSNVHHWLCRFMALLVIFKTFCANCLHTSLLQNTESLAWRTNLMNWNGMCNKSIPWRYCCHPLIKMNFDFKKKKNEYVFLINTFTDFKKQRNLNKTSFRIKNHLVLFIFWFNRRKYWQVLQDFLLQARK